VKEGKLINGYKILRDFSTAGGGLSKWTFAEKGGKEYFFKEFLSPTYPDDKAPGSEKIKAQKRERCRLFEAHHKSLKKATEPVCSEGGNLIATLDFFRAGTKYYKTTEKVDVAGLTIKEIATLSLEKRILILKTVAHSLNILHQLNIVHGDLKPDNILIKQTATGNYTSKLIDFDNSYFSGKPPLVAEEVVGDMVYYSPELAAYIKQESSVRPEDLQAASDIFALGLIYSLYLTGRLPYFDVRKYQYAHEAVLDGNILTISKKGIPADVINVVDQMLRRVPKERPRVKEVFNKLKGVKSMEALPISTSSPVSTTGKLKISMSSGDKSKPPESKSRLSGSLVKKK
jgi:serine/threonine protein kinase